MSKDVDAMKAVDFQWTTHIDSVWHTLPFHVPELQAHATSELDTKLGDLLANRGASPLGVPLLGSAGSGKTHLLSGLRKSALERGLFFVLVDMTDVNDFDETVLLGTLRSLGQPDASGRPQHIALLAHLIQEFGDRRMRERGIQGLAEARPPALINQCNQLIHAVRALYPREGGEYQDVLRSVVLLASTDFDIVDLGDGWLQGIGIQEDDAHHHGFRLAQQKPGRILRGLSWLMSLARPTVLALDQLDAMVAEHDLASSAEEGKLTTLRQKLSQAIIQGIAGGLSALRDMTRRTQIIASCLETTWAILDLRSQISMRDRFEEPIMLRPLSDPHMLRRLVELRLQAAYGSVGFQPPYPSYPFREAFFGELKGWSPRELLKRCDNHRRHCLRIKRVVETGDTSSIELTSPDFGAIERRFTELSRCSPIETILQQEDEEALNRLLEEACIILTGEEHQLPEEVDAQVDVDFPGTGSYEPLHARIRLVYPHKGDRERHYAFRFLQKSHYRAFQARLKAAITASGIARDLTFRRLAILRVGPVPSGKVCEHLMADLRERGGLLLEPDLEALSRLWAVCQLRSDPNYASVVSDWLAREKPLSNLIPFRDAAQWLFGSWQGASTGERQPSRELNDPHPREATDPGAPEQKTPFSPPSGIIDKQRLVSRPDAELPVGRRLQAGKSHETVQVPLVNLRKHAVVLAGAGSGKTVLLKRLIEEAVLLGVPAILIDGANDLALLGDAWDAAPEAWSEEDRRKATEYHLRSEVVIWTPGIQRANPLTLNPLPDLAAVRDDPDELNAAIDMARTSLAALAASGRGQAAQVSLGVLTDALRYFAKMGGGSLGDLIGLLQDLPPEAYDGFKNGAQIASKLGEQLLAQTKVNPLLAAGGTALDPSILLTSADPGKVRVSVVNLSGLQSLVARQQFVDQLSMTMFSYIKRHPAHDRPLLGLMVIDEAKDFVPSGASVPGKENIIRLAAQARKYGLGLLFATQAPKSIDHNVIANCATQFYGRAASPAAIETVQEQIKLRGGQGSDVATLQRGTFYVYTEGLAAPVRVTTPLCLSAHPPSPPDELQIVERAQQQTGVGATRGAAAR